MKNGTGIFSLVFVTLCKNHSAQSVLKHTLLVAYANNSTSVHSQISHYYIQSGVIYDTRYVMTVMARDLWETGNITHGMQNSLNALQNDLLE